MPTGQQISVEFIREVLWPLLESELGSDAQRLAVAVIGTGSDVVGLDDEISRDHHWGPRANVMVLREDAVTLLPRVYDVLSQKLPRDYNGFHIEHDLTSMTGVCVTAIDQFFGYFLGTDQLPTIDLDWLQLCEVDLLHVTSGVVVIDGPGELTRRRDTLAYYPDHIWGKRIADWCMYITGRDAPYNIYRTAKRNDLLTGTIYKSQYAKQVMELCFTLNRRYAPYTKWLNRTFRKLPQFASDVAPQLDAIMATSDLRTNTHQMIELNYTIAEAIAELGVARKPTRVAFDEGLTDLTLYGTAAQIYETLPPAVLAPSFNRIELWERLARDVVMDQNDYFRKRPEAR
ncbi:MAG: DUF4037 domain-containing protein [Candidatus Sumerlaeaceae bacterium]